MPRRKTRKKKKGYSPLLLILMGSALTLCALSVMYGFLIRKSMAHEGFKDIKVEVLNGTKEQGLARQVRASLRNLGTDVLDVGNADEMYAESILIGRRKTDRLEAFGKAVGCKNIIEEYRDDSLVDATLILGADYRKLNVGYGGD